MRPPDRHHHQHLHHLIPLLHLQINSDDSTFNVLQLNPNGMGNKLTELGVVMENNKVKVAVIHGSKLTPKSKNPCIQNYTTVRKDRPRGQGEGLLIFIHRSVTFSKQPLLLLLLFVTTRSVFKSVGCVVKLHSLYICRLVR